MNAESILVLEDNVVTMKGLTIQLVEAGYQVVGAATTNEAIFALRNYRVDLILLDLNLLAEDPFNGVSDGFAFKEWVQKLFPNFNLPVIVYTSDTSPNLEARARQHGVTRVLRKGAPLQELLGAIRESLEQHRSARCA